MPVEITTPGEEDERPRGQSVARGFACRCPHCGEGNLFRAWMKPVETCPVCGEDLSHQRADDFPPYITMVLTGHILVPLMLAGQMLTDFSVMTYLAIYLPITVISVFGLMQPVKGAVIGLQWALRMHGFDGRANPDAPPEGFLPGGSTWPRPDNA
jgi:uncharacterized protein (DUF983 family)